METLIILTNILNKIIIKINKKKNINNHNSQTKSNY